MAVDKLVDSAQLDADLTSVANAIRTKGGTSSQLAFPAGFVSAIADIPSGGVGVKTGTVTPTNRTLTITFDSELSTIQGILVVPDTETPLKSGGKTCVGIIYTPNCYYHYFGLTSNNAGASLLTPAVNNVSFSVSGTTVTITSGQSTPGYFETITYRWYAW